MILIRLHSKLVTQTHAIHSHDMKRNLRMSDSIGSLGPDSLLLKRAFFGHLSPSIYHSLPIRLGRFSNHKSQCGAIYSNWSPPCLLKTKTHARGNVSDGGKFPTRKTTAELSFESRASSDRCASKKNSRSWWYLVDLAITRRSIIGMRVLCVASWPTGLNRELASHRLDECVHVCVRAWSTFSKNKDWFTTQTPLLTVYVS